jgi:glycosyltransferase involved in cell wall biosynthesis
VLFLGRTYAGHRTRFRNLQAHVTDDPCVEPLFREVSGWVEGGWIERLPIGSRGFRGRVRATLEASAISALPRPDVIWTSAIEVAVPHLWSQLGALRRPLVIDLDWTLEQQEALAPVYFGRQPKRRTRRMIAKLFERALWSTATLFTPWSQWAADSLRRQGVPDNRIRVLPPGVDLDLWLPCRSPRRSSDERLRLLFVGGDFVRKGGDILLDVLRTRFADRCELDIVTRETVPFTAGVRVHKMEANSKELMDLYAAADMFVLPSRAECFGIATIEALASGLPVIASDSGGAHDIVDEGKSGWLIDPTPAALTVALERALEHRAVLPHMGSEGRRRAENRFNGRRNDKLVVELLVEQARQGRAGRGGVRP